jgi:hypothetical protein
MKRREIPVECTALSGSAIMLRSYYYFSLSVSFFKIPDSFSNRAQLVLSIDDRFYFALVVSSICWLRKRSQIN